MLSYKIVINNVIAERGNLFAGWQPAGSALNELLWSITPFVLDSLTPKLFQVFMENKQISI